MITFSISGIYDFEIKMGKFAKKGSLYPFIGMYKNGEEVSVSLE